MLQLEANTPVHLHPCRQLFGGDSGWHCGPRPLKPQWNQVQPRRMAMTSPEEPCNKHEPLPSHRGHGSLLGISHSTDLSHILPNGYRSNCQWAQQPAALRDHTGVSFPGSEMVCTAAQAKHCSVPCTRGMDAHAGAPIGFQKCSSYSQRPTMQQCRNGKIAPFR